jgi:hypothetical protein
MELWRSGGLRGQEDASNADVPPERQCQESHPTTSYYRRQRPTDKVYTIPAQTTVIPIPNTRTPFFGIRRYRRYSTRLSRGYATTVDRGRHSTRLSRGYGTTVDRGRHSTRLLLFLRVPSSRVQTCPATAVGQSRIPTQDRGVTIAYCSRGSTSVV